MHGKQLKIFSKISVNGWPAGTRDISIMVYGTLSVSAGPATLLRAPGARQGMRIDRSRTFLMALYDAQESISDDRQKRAGVLIAKEKSWHGFG
jgi:hypothetical protein